MKPADMIPVSAEDSVLRLCRAIVTLRKFEDDEGLDDSPISYALTEIMDAVLDLCGIPEDGEGFVRDMWRFELHDLLKSDATDDDFRRVIQRMQDLWNVESVMRSKGEKIEKRFDEPEPTNPREFTDADRARLSAADEKRKRRAERPRP